MTNNLLSEDNTLPTSPSAPPPSAATLLTENVKELAGEASVNVMTTPSKSTPMSIPHTHPNKGVCSVSDLSPSTTPTSTRPSTPTVRPISHRRSAGVSSEENKHERKEHSLSDAHTTHHLKRSKRFRVYVRNSMGTVHEVKVRETDSVRRVKEKISMATDMLPQSIHLLLAGVELADERVTMGQLGVVEGNTLSVAPRLQSGQMEMVEGMPFNEESLYEKIMSQLSDKQMEELSSGTLNKPLSFVTTIGGKRVLVRLKPAHDGTASGSSSTSPAASAHPDLEPWTRGATSSTGVRRDAQWRKEKQVEHQNMRSRMDTVREQLRNAKVKPAHGVSISVESAEEEKEKTVVAKTVVEAGSAVKPAVVAETQALVPAAKKNRCHSCNTKLGPIVFPCRCSHAFCSSHRHDHQCTFDYKQQRK